MHVIVVTLCEDLFYKHKLSAGYSVIGVNMNFLRLPFLNYKPGQDRQTDRRTESYRRTSQGTGGCPQTRANHYFQAKAKFFGQKRAAEDEKRIFFFAFIKRKKGIHSV